MATLFDILEGVLLPTETMVKWSNNLGYSGFISQRDLATLISQY